MKCKYCKEKLDRLNYEIKKIETGIYENGNLHTLSENQEGDEFNFYCPFCDELLASSMSDGKALMKKIQR